MLVIIEHGTGLFFELLHYYIRHLLVWLPATPVCIPMQSKTNYKQTMMLKVGLKKCMYCYFTFYIIVEYNANTL